MNVQNFRQSSLDSARTAVRSRRGISILEFVGCLLALVGGLWLGAIYFGVNVKEAAYVALNDSQLAEQVPEGWRPEGLQVKKPPTAEELAASVQNELTSLRAEITTLDDAHGQSVSAVAIAGPGTAASEDSDNAARQATLAYWTKLNEVVRNQAQLQVEAERAANEANATKVAALKARINRFSASGIRALATADVDPAAVKLGQELADWYEQGASLFDQAVQVWESPGRAQSGQQMPKEWERNQAQYANEGRLMKDRVTAVRESLTRRFGEGFAPIGGI